MSYFSIGSARPWNLALGCSVATGALAQAVLPSNGALSEPAIKWLAFSLVAVVVGLFLPRMSWFERHAEAIIVTLCGAMLAYQFGQLLFTPPGIYLQPTGEMMTTFQAELALAAVFAGAGLSQKPWLGRVQHLVVVLAFAALGWWMIRASPRPFIDVFVFQKGAVEALQAGIDPYTLRYPDIYGNSTFYGEGLSVGGQLQFGYPYPPLSLWAILPAEWWLGDFRYAQVLSMVIAVALLGLLTTNRVARTVPLVFLFAPRSLFVIEQGWTEPLVMVFLALVIFSAVKWPRVLPYALGLFLAVKQYLVFAVPLMWLLLPRPMLPRAELAKWLFKIVATGLLVSLPLALWHPKDFWFDVAALQVYQPFRNDALSFLAWAVSQGRERPSTVWAFVAALVGLGISLWRLPRSIGGFTTGLAFTLLLFFAFNKQAFCNYYTLVIGALAAAAAALTVAVDDELAKTPIS